MTYRYLKVQVDEDPNMVIHYTIKSKKGLDNHYIKIHGIEYDVEIDEILEKSKAEIRLFNLGKTYSPIRSFFPMSVSQSVSQEIDQFH